MQNYIGAMQIGKRKISINIEDLTVIRKQDTAHIIKHCKCQFVFVLYSSHQLHAAPSLMSHFQVLIEQHGQETLTTGFVFLQRRRNDPCQCPLSVYVFVFKCIRQNMAQTGRDDHSARWESNSSGSHSSFGTRLYPRRL